LDTYFARERVILFQLPSMGRLTGLRLSRLRITKYTYYWDCLGIKFIWPSVASFSAALKICFSFLLTMTTHVTQILNVFLKRCALAPR